MVPLEHGIDPVRHVFGPDGPIVDLEMELRNGFDPVRKRVFLSK